MCATSLIVPRTYACVMANSGPPGDWHWDESEESLVHPAGVCLSPTASPTGGQLWRLTQEVVADGYVATVTDDEFATTGGVLTDEDIETLLAQIDAGSQRLHAVAITDPVNESFVDVYCVRPGSLPPTLDIDDVRRHATSFVFDDDYTHDGADSTADRAVDPSVGDTARLSLEVFPTPASRVTDTDLLDESVTPSYTTTATEADR